MKKSLKRKLFHWEQFVLFRNKEQPIDPVFEDLINKAKASKKNYFEWALPFDNSDISQQLKQLQVSLKKISKRSSESRDWFHFNSSNQTDFEAAMRLSRKAARVFISSTFKGPFWSTISLL